MTRTLGCVAAAVLAALCLAGIAQPRVRRRPHRHGRERCPFVRLRHGDRHAGEALTAGQLVYRKSSDGKWYKADCNSATAEVRVASAVALTGSAAGQPVVVQRSGSVTIGATLTAGTVYYLSGTPGGIRPAADNTTGDYPQVVGIATSTTVLSLNFGLRATSPL
jgi:hypothetical protein